MRIGLISDVHGNSVALKAVLAELLPEADQIIFLGDLCGYYPFVNECVDLWRQDRIVGIRGNHDQVLLDCLRSGVQPDGEYQRRYGSALGRTLRDLSSLAKALLQSLPVSRTLTVGGTDLSLFHGAPWDPLEGRVYPDYDAWDRFADVSGDVVLLGHTHYPFVKRCHGKLIVNPGSVGQARDHRGGASFAILDLTSGEVQHRHLSFDPQRLVEDAQRHDPSLPYLVEVLVRR